MTETDGHQSTGFSQSRRDFLFNLLNLGGAVAILAACAPLLPKSASDPEAATTNSGPPVDINATHVAATTTAQSPAEYQAEIDKIPQNLFETAGMVTCVLARGSATALEYSNGILYLLTAGHVVQGMEQAGLGSNYGFTFVKPQVSFNQQWGQFQVGYAMTPPDQTGLHEYGILAVRIPDWQHPVFSVDNLIDSWKPESETHWLHALSFPHAASSQTSFPASFTVSPVTFESNSQPIQLFGTTQDFSGGSSGSLAVTEEGKAVAIIVSVSSTGNTSYLAPLNKTTIIQLMNQAKSKIPSS